MIIKKTSPSPSFHAIKGLPMSEVFRGQSQFGGQIIWIYILHNPSISVTFLTRSNSWVPNKVSLKSRPSLSPDKYRTRWIRCCRIRKLDYFVTSELTLTRHSSAVPWGFTLSGGRDQGLTVKVIIIIINIIVTIIIRWDVSSMTLSRTIAASRAETLSGRYQVKR